MSETKPSYLSVGTGATSRIMPSQLSNLYFIPAIPEGFENLDTIALTSETITSKGKTAFFSMALALASVSTFQDKNYSVKSLATNAEPINSPVENTEPLSEEELEEIEWNKILNKPHVRRGLRRRAAEVRRQIAAGETEEGGFAIE